MVLSASSWDIHVTISIQISLPSPFSKNRLHLYTTSFNWEEYLISFLYNNIFIAVACSGPLSDQDLWERCSSSVVRLLAPWCGLSASLQRAGKQPNLPKSAQHWFKRELLTNPCSMKSWTVASLLPTIWRQVSSSCGIMSIPPAPQNPFFSSHVLWEPGLLLWSFKCPQLIK